MEDEEFASKFQEVHKMRLKNPEATINLILSLYNHDLTEKQILILKIEQAYCLWVLSKRLEAFKLYNDVLDKAIAQSFSELQADALNGIAIIEGEQGNLTSSIKHFTKSIEIYGTLSKSKKLASALNRLAVIKYTKGDFDGATELFNKVMEFSHDNIMAINACNNIALINMERGKIAESVKDFKWCFEQAKKLKFSRTICTMQNNYAEALRNIGEFSKAETNYQEALLRAKKLDDKKNIGLLNTSYAELLIDKGEFDKAEALFREALHIQEELNEIYQHIVILNGFAKFWLTKGYYDEALNYLTEAKKLIDQSGIQQPKIENCVLFSEIYIIFGQTGLAYDYLKEGNKLAWEINSNEGKARILIERARINLFNLNMEEAELLLNDANKLALESNLVTINFRAKFLLANLFLIKFQSKPNNKTFYDQAMSQVLEIKEKSKEKFLFLDYINACIIESMLLSIDGDNRRAEEILIQVENLGKQRGMVKQVKHAQDRLFLITKELKSQQRKEFDYSQIITTGIIREIQDIMGAIPVPNLSLSDLDNIFLITYEIDEIFGPRVLNSFNVDLEDFRFKKTIEMVGSLYIVSLSHGSDFHEGLFGPFPFGTTSLNALVFSKALLNKQKKRISTLLCIVFPKKFSPYLYNQYKLELFIQKHLEYTQFLDDVDSELLGNIYMDLMETFFKKLLDS